jgi:hypothetical protein
MSRRIKKLEYHCDPEVNNHRECSGKVIENEETFNCECECHITESEFLMSSGKIPRWFSGFGL